MSISLKNVNLLLRVKTQLIILFIASIGGQMGLCLGASLLTIVETMEVFGLACIRSAKK